MCRLFCKSQSAAEYADSRVEESILDVCGSVGVDRRINPESMRERRVLKYSVSRRLQGAIYFSFHMKSTLVVFPDGFPCYFLCCMDVECEC